MGRITTEDLYIYKNRLALLNAYCFIREVNSEILFNNAVLNPLMKKINSEDYSVCEIQIKKNRHLFIIKRLTWDSEYFGFLCQTVEMILFNHSDIGILRWAINFFIKSYVPQKSYITINVPSEDILLIQAISSTKFNLIETRLHYCLKLNKTFDYQNLNTISQAHLSDIPELRLIAKKMRNVYDRVHADPAFSDEVADNYLAQFVEESIKGFADIVLKIFDDKGIPFGFLAANYPFEISGLHISKLVLAAVDSDGKKGKLIDLLKEMIFQLKLKRSDYLTTITQSANKPAIRVWEKMGFSLYMCSHLYSFKND
jgi:dTDP-4-amino-4,6-dideoxy-D-galactose acyltransferase